MAEGLLFYWLSWILWIIVTFLMKKSTTRTLFSSWILFSISLSNLYFTVYSFDVSALFLMFIAGSLFMYSYLGEKTHYLYRPFIIMIGYGSLLLLEKSMPVWVFIPNNIAMPVICCLLIIILSEDIYCQLVSGILGIASGELLFSLILHSYDLPKEIGDEFFFDIVLVTVALIVCVDMLQKVRKRAFSFVA